MQPIIWCVEFKDGKKVLEFEDVNKENSFIQLLPRKNDFKLIALLDVKNNLKYVIDLKTGEFILNGLAISMSKNLDGRQHYFTNLPNVNYAEGVIQYKCSEPMTIGVNATAVAATYNIGYKIPWNFEYWVRDDKQAVTKHCITHVQAMITVDANTLRVGVSSAFTARITDPNGNERFCKL